MIILEERKKILEHCKKQELLVEHNLELFNIFEGDLLTYVLKDLKKCFSLKTFEKIITRVAPVNVLKKIIDKLSKIYQQNVLRCVDYGTEQDSELLKEYEEQFCINMKMNQSNEFFNLFKNSLIQIYYHPKKRMLQARIIPSQQFTVWSNDSIEPNIPTHIILYYGKNEAGKNVYCIYSDEQFLIIDEENTVQTKMMENSGNPTGHIPWGEKPFIYINKSLNQIIPIPDSDTLKMTKLIPILISDINYAVMYQAFSIIWGIDVEDKNLEMNPSAFWHFKSDPNSTNKPEIGVIKPQVDISETLMLIQAELAFWLETRGIKPGALGTLNSNNFASGVSKMIDEADTYEDRIKQIEYYKDAESRFWNLAIKKMHNYFASVGAIDNQYIFSAGAEIDTKFPEQKPMTSRSDLVNTLKTERDAGFISTERAIEMLNPDMTETDIAELILEIQAERSITIQEAELPAGSELPPTITELPVPEMVELQ